MASTTSPPPLDASGAVPAPPSARARGLASTPARRDALVVVACLALAALSLLAPSSPTYDPWAWLIWGREIIHVDLVTATGPSWKPLPMLFIVPFSLLGDAAPSLWLVVARAGGLLSLVVAWRLAVRLGAGRAVAGVVAAGAMALPSWSLRNVWLGNSEGLMVLCLLAAVLAHLEGRRRGAFAWGLAAALLRPEAWPFFGLYGLWLLWRERRRVAVLVAAGFASLPVLWLLPELWGSGDLLRAASRAQQPRASAVTFSDFPVLTIIANAASMVAIPAYVGLVAAVVLLVRGRLEGPERRAIGGILALAVAWTALVALMTSGGFSGSERYLVAPVSLLLVVAGAGAGQLLQRLPVGSAGPAAVAAVTAVAGLLVLTQGIVRLPNTVAGMVHQSVLPNQLTEVIAAAGGRERLLACGQPATGPLLVPQVAWALGVHGRDVALDAQPGGVVLRVRTTRVGEVAPPLEGLGPGPRRTLAATRFWRVVAACPGAGA